jgi:cytochrome c7-like protein
MIVMMLRFLGWLALVGAAYAEGEPKPPLGAAPAQPLPFSHRAHATTAALKCSDCHKSVSTAAEAGFPPTGLCMSCHVAVKKGSPAIAKLAEYHATQKTVPWLRVYQLPRFVAFSHLRHHGKAQIACETCHGDVAAQDVVSKAKSIAMPACQSCHDARKANNNCNVCHEAHPG